MKKWFYLRVDLALLGTITIHLIVWPMLFVCAGSPIKNIYSSTLDDSNFNDDDNNVRVGNNNDKFINSPATSHHQEEEMILTNNSSYEVSTKNDKIAHVFNNYLQTMSSTVDDENNDKHRANKIIENNDNNKYSNYSQISSIYEIFFIKNKINIKNSNALMRTDRSAHSNANKSKETKRVKKSKVKSLSTLDRNERSANLSHITGSARKIQLYIKNRFVQLMPDGTVNGTTDDLSDFSKFLIINVNNK